ncbi:MAG TPA: MBL fold metallo-hydrolase [Candidatus Limnocylindria bacterium]|nr:MBL fold metallo-hydrolase [Candidatus Limnocylindria bacterium]
MAGDPEAQPERADHADPVRQQLHPAAAVAAAGSAAYTLKLLQRVVGPIATNLYVLGDEPSGEAVAIDTATPCVEWLTTTLAERGWRLKLIVSTHRHWDHIGDNAAVSAATGADIAAHIADRHGLEHPTGHMAPFPIPPSVPAVDLMEGSTIRFGEIMLSVLHTPGHTEGSVCLLADSERLLFTGDTLFARSWGRTDLAGGSEEQMIDSLGRLSALEDGVRVLPGHGSPTTIVDERPWLEQVKQTRLLPF